MFYALAGGHEHLQDSNGNADPQGNQGAREKARLFPMQLDALLPVVGSQAIHILVMLDLFREGKVFGSRPAV